MEIVATTNDRKSLRSLMQHLGEQGVDTLTNYIEAKFRMNNETLLEKLATKEDITLVKGDIARLETDVSELKTEVKGLNEAITCVRVDIPTLQAKMEAKISGGSTEILRWMLTLFVVTMLAIIGLYFKI